MATSPSASLATLRPDLAQSFESFDLEAQQKAFIGMEVLPMTTVAEQAGNYGIIPPEQMLIQREDLRAPGASYNRGTSTFKALTYACMEHGVEEAVDDREAKMYANYFDAESFAARRARDTVLRNTEARVIGKIADLTNNFTAGLNNYSTATSQISAPVAGTFGASWKTVASSDPVSDVALMSKAIYANSGLIPNTIVIGYNKFWDLRRTASIQTQIKYSGLDDPKMSAVAARQILAELFGVQNFLVAGAQYASNKQGQVLALASLWNNGQVLLAKCATSQDFKEACLGRIFHWEADGSSPNGTVESYRDESRRSNIVRVRMDTDEQVILPTAGYLLAGIDA
jgi:hypothetical protein